MGGAKMTKRELKAKITEIIDRRQRTRVDMNTDSIPVLKIDAELNALNAILDALNGNDDMINSYIQTTILDALIHTQ